ncbi:PE-PPE domain-containing protein [Mycolicibacterium wolinskyi]|uniref:PE-PPE domain-containing protein n=1 Tax=Mycolicibacterium wolinskyi TaxID=59750 RepID=A0A1X2FJR7_9MYCO|nr:MULTISPECIES: PE-PPE domain-containing protein [Mycolicibacterium]MCV7290048.1 PE-PPE domain-containing protein [Mycolicibacterium wolinskyi]MCV7293083.1 PE-PPE domain-containing protein [Mycolicibacterium goodii]ORX18683.1 PE-PPE domain-containing protein [Mycolicibacterium wolinskyi]
MCATARSTVRALLVAILVLTSTVALGVTAAFSAAISAAVGLVVATTPLVVPGTGTPDPADSNNYMAHAVAYYVETSGSCGDGCSTPVPVSYIAQFWPFPFEGWGGLQGAKWNVSVASGVASLNDQLDIAAPDNEHPVVIFGYSQGAAVTSIVKRQLAEDNGGTIPDWIDFVVIGNPNRPNGGLFERLAALGTVPILDATFGEPTPTDTSQEVNTYDIALQYDGVADAPSWLLNPLALANALAGFEYTHPTYLAPDGDDLPTETPYGYTPQQVQAAIENAQESCTAETHCQERGDTRYITLPAKVLPIMQPFLDFAESTGTSALVVPIVDLVSPLAQTLIETGYDREDYSKPTPFQLLPKVDPVKLVTDLAGDIPEGINAALNPGLDPLPGWTDPTEDDDAVPAPDATVDDAAVPVTKQVTTRPDRKPLTRLSAIARPAEGLTQPKEGTEIERPSLRKALGIKGHPVRDFAKSVQGSVRKALGHDDEKAADTKQSDASQPAA